MALGIRQARAVVLIAGALLAVAVASFAYLRPPAAVTTTKAPATVTIQGVQWSESQLVLQINLTGRTDGGYFVWNRVPGGSGGHAG